MTIIIRARDYAPSFIIDLASRYLNEDRLVVLPTETVYGLAARACSEHAARRLLEVKGLRESPFTIHVSSLEEVCSLARVSNDVETLLEQLWPGPLTAVLHAEQSIARGSRSMSGKAGFRIPRHPLTLEVLRRSGPCLMPSANKHDRPSPVDVQDVLEDLEDLVDLVIDAGTSEIGIDSTVVDFTETPPLLLRPGALTVEKLSELGVTLRLPTHLQKVLEKRKYVSSNTSIIAISPGTLTEILKKIREKLTEAERNDLKTLLVVSRELFVNLHREHLPKKTSLIVYGSRTLEDVYPGFIYKVFRYIDKLRFDLVIIECPPKWGLGLAITDRVLAAADHVI